MGVSLKSERRVRRPLGPLETPSVLFILVGVGFRSINSEDLTFWDEAAYISRALNAKRGIWPSFTEGAVYSDYYWALSQLVTDPVTLYFAGRSFAAILLVVGIWGAARLLVSPILAWVAAAIAATSPLPYLWPGVAAPASAAIILGVAILIRSTAVGALGLVAGLFWIAAGARPEFVWLALITSVTALSALGFDLLWARRIWNTKTARDVVSVVVCVGMIPVLLMATHGSPFDSNNRDWVAFSQHFSQRHVGAGEDPWLDAAEIVTRFFGSADGVLAALVANPNAFFQHLTDNLVIIPSTIRRQNLDLSLGSLREGSVSAWMVVVLIVSVLISLAPVRGRTIQRLRISAMRLPHGREWIRIPIIVALAASVLLPAAIVYPRAHYLVVPTALLIIALVAIQDRWGSDHLNVILPFALTVALFSIWSFQTAALAIDRLSNPAPMALTASRMEAMDRTWRLLAVDWGLTVYVSRLSRVEAEPENAQETFVDFLTRNNVNALLINDRFNAASWSQLAGFEVFKSDPGSFGFEQVTVGSPVWIRRSESN